MKPTIKISELNLADWKEIACALEKDAKWAFYRWQGNCTVPFMPMEEWEKIADECGFAQGWAYHQYKNQSVQLQGVK